MNCVDFVFFQQKDTLTCSIANRVNTVADTSGDKVSPAWPTGGTYFALQGQGQIQLDLSQTDVQNKCIKTTIGAVTSFRCNLEIAFRIRGKTQF
jgi:hypothetical protein